MSEKPQPSSPEDWLLEEPPHPLFGFVRNLRAQSKSWEEIYPEARAWNSRQPVPLQEWDFLAKVDWCRRRF